MVVLTNCEEPKTNRAIEYSEELNCFYSRPLTTYFPPLPTTFPLSPLPFPPYLPVSPTQPSTSNSRVLHIWNGYHFFDLPDFNVALLAEYTIQDRGGALDVIPSGRLIKINGLVAHLEDMVGSDAKNIASLVEQHEDWDHFGDFLKENKCEYILKENKCEYIEEYVEGEMNFQELEKQDVDIVDQLVVDSGYVVQHGIQYRGGKLHEIPGEVFSWFNGPDTREGQVLTSIPEPAHIFQTKFSLRLWQGRRGNWTTDVRFGWNWLNTGTFKTAESAPLWSESVVRLRGGKDLFDYPFPKLFVNKNREDTTRASRTGIPLLQLPLTEQESDEFEALGIGSESTVECEMAEARLKSGCSGKGKRKEKNSGQERRNKGKTNGVRIAIPLEDILQTKGMQLKDAAKHLKVSPSTLKRVCRGYNIERWPPHKKRMLIGQSCPKESPMIVHQERIPHLNFDRQLAPNQILASIDTDNVIIKANYESYTIKFQLSRPWKMAKLEEQVKKRLELEAGTYHIMYKDENDELILIACDEDLQYYISSSRLCTTSIKVLLQRK